MEALTEYDKKILNDIDIYGWHVIMVPEDEQGPSFGYSVGLFQSFDHPEIIVIGLKLEAIHYLLNKMGDAIREGIRFEPGQFYSNLLEGVDCYFTSVHPDHYKEYVDYGKWYYKEEMFSLLQCIYPTVTGIYPWQAQWPDILKDQQPVLGTYPKDS